ncbi:OmpH family outer membrane protein [Ectothiorhodospira lacustris]|uniref:OmpH family outer membrane protein n=1 Tax=Ectothiorhodospira lacustris TaxID=2899127 RepID=UPI001EE7F1ED|nr:OmpH family outer membrane protein [Ectothiorhodospira lacustris]MCG5500069.1 OmpH family outer membrane protein [Ectothiorhodospira lacustris]MCG5509423.1 OmpH family outer membrane protein [Ectothiorhodospira lacustris]MCG5521477.1 OmpH family outer membrane protein [Ectothiorhodospira lacustris]
MKRNVLRITTGLLLVCLLAISGAAVANAKVAFVNINRVMEQSPQAEASLRALEEEFSPRDSELVAERDALRRMQERLQRDSEVMGADQRAQLEREFRNRSREFTRAQDMFQEDLNVRRNDELARLQRLVQSVILDIARADNVDLVVTERTVLFASDRIDMTGKVLEELRRQHQRPRR